MRLLPRERNCYAAIAGMARCTIQPFWKERPSTAACGMRRSSRPSLCSAPFETLAEAIEIANDPEYSLHAGIFTNNLSMALDAANRIEASGVMINDSSDYRFDAMPFGGFKYGSLGREGVRVAFEDMTQTKVVCINHG